jgi:hypothetical protein
MEEEHGPLASAAPTTRNIGGGLEVSLLREYVEELEAKQLHITQQAELCRAENQVRDKDQADVYYYLNKKLDDNYDVIHTLEEQIIREQSEREISEKEYEQAIEALQGKMAADESRYKSRLLELENKLEQVREYMGQKDEFLGQVEELTGTIQKDKADFAQRYEDLDKARIQEKQQLRNDFNLEMESVKRHHKADIDSKLSDKAKKSKILNTMYKKELKYQTLQAEEVLVHDSAVTARDRARRTEMDLSKGMEEELQKKLVEYQRTIRSLNKRISEDSGKIQDTSAEDAANKKYDQKCIEYDALLAALEEHKLEAKAETERSGKIWKVLMEHYYDFQKRGVRRPLNKLEIEANPERFVTELLFGAFEANPARFRKAIKKHLGGTGAQTGGSFFSEDNNGNESSELNDDSMSLLPDEQKWWSTQNTSYIAPSSADFAVVDNSSRTGGSGFSLPNSTRGAGMYSSSKSAGGGPKAVSLRNACVQTDESSFVQVPTSQSQMGSVDENELSVGVREAGSATLSPSPSIASSNFVIDSFSAPNLKYAGHGSGVLSSNGGSLFMDNFAGASVDGGIGIGGNMLRRHGHNSRSHNAVNFTRKGKKVHKKKLILPRLNHLSTPPTPQTDFSLTGQPMSSKNNNLSGNNSNISISITRKPK